MVMTKKSFCEMASAGLLYFGWGAVLLFLVPFWIIGKLADLFDLDWFEEHPQ